MPIVVRCPECGTLLKFHESALGKKGKCKKCQAIVRIVPAEKTPARDADDEAAFLGNLSDAVATGAQGEIIPINREPGAASVSEKAAASGPVDEEQFAFAPTRLGTRPRVRIVVAALLLVPIAFAPGLGPLDRLFACFTPLILVGTFRTSMIEGARFTTRLYIAFIPLKTQNCSLRSVAFINVKFGWEGPGFGTMIIAGAFLAAVGWLFELLVPALGGPYQIHLVTAKGREMVAWRGYVDSQFRRTLDLLVRLTNAEIRSL
jgi:hypothetical protein